MGHHIIWYTGTSALGEPAVCIFREVCSSAQKPVAACFSKTLVISTKVHHVTSWKNMILTHLSLFLSCAWKRIILLCYILHFLHMLCAYIFLLCTFIQGWNMQNVIGSGEPDFAIIVVKISVSLECWLKYTSIKLYEGRGHIIWMKPVLQHRSLASLDPTHVVLQRYTVILYKTNWSCSISGSQNQLAWTRLDYTSVPTALCCCECKQVKNSSHRAK